MLDVRIATWNVNSLKVRMPRVLEFLEQHRPDVLLMQETKSEPDAFPAMELDAAGYGAVHHSAGRWAGWPSPRPWERRSPTCARARG